MTELLAGAETPALVVEAAQVDRNVAKVAAYAAAHGLAWRPHTKTHKSAWTAGREVRGGARGLTCATTREAEVMRAATDDLLLAYPPVGAARAARAAALAATSGLTVALDSVEAAAALDAALRARGARARVLVEVDAGMRRTGVPTAEAAVALAREVAARPSLEAAGFAFYPGHVRGAGPEADAPLRALGALCTELRERAAAAGLPAPVLSAGSTPLLWRSHEIAGLTEIRAGTCVYFDRTSVLGGVATEAECAATVLATVVSVAVPGQAVVDAGTKALGREPVSGGQAEGFASVRGRPEVTVSRLSEEHGILDLAHTDWRPRVGERVQLVPNHICVAVSCFSRMLVVEDEVMEREVEARDRS